MTKLFVKSFNLEGAVVDGVTIGGISVFDGDRLKSFAWQPGHLATLKEIIAYHVSKHLSDLPTTESREQEFVALKGKTTITRDQEITLVTECKVVANNERTEIHLDSDDGAYILHLDNVCVIHLDREFAEKFYSVAPEGGSLQ